MALNSPNISTGSNKKSYLNEDRKKKIKKFLNLVYEQRYIQLMVIPAVIWMIIFNYIPMYGIIIAFKDFNIVRPISAAPWVGLEHFREFFRDDRFWLVLKNTLGISVLKLVIGFPLPIIFALLLNELKSVRYKKTVQTISYLPHFLSWVVLGGIMMNWLADTGLINTVLVSIGVIKEPIVFLAEPKYFWGISIISDIWKELGWSAIIYLAAIAGVDQEMYEAATVDGANRFQKMTKITLPAISGTVAILFILAISRLLNSNFDQIFVLRNSLNVDASDVIDIFVYRMGLQSGRFSFSTAAGLFKSVIAFILLLTANFATKKIKGTSLF
jgi:putative aldouronate transport system permease protein